MKDGEHIRFVVNRTHDGQPLAGKIRSAWEGILEDQVRREDLWCLIMSRVTSHQGP
jgi:hypothetical protein